MNGSFFPCWHDYEKRAFPIDKPDPFAVIRFRMETKPWSGRGSSGSAAAVEIEMANPTGAAGTALAERTIDSAVAVPLIPRRDKCSRSLSSARETRF